MFSKKKIEPSKRLELDYSQFSLTEASNDFDPSGDYGDGDAGDSDLEAELAIICNQTSGTTERKPKAKPLLLTATQLEEIVAGSLQDVSDDDDATEIENDTELLNELQNISEGTTNVEDITSSTFNININLQPQPEMQSFVPTTAVDTLAIIKERIEMYRRAEIIAKDAGEDAKTRRISRGLKTLQDILKQVTLGKKINTDDLPPEIGFKSVAPPIVTEDSTPNENLKPTTPENLPNVTQDSPEILAQMRSRQSEYKATALEYKRRGEVSTALQFLKVVKQFDVVIKMCEEGQDVDLSDMPPKASEFLEFLTKMQQILISTEDKSGEQLKSPEEGDISERTDATLCNMLEALQQRLDKYKSIEDAAKVEGNDSKARRFGRIVKQYDNAIKSYKAGQSVPYDELPVPPGFGPLPAEPTQISTGSPSPSHSASMGGSTLGVSSTATTPKVSTACQREELTTRVSGNQQKNNLAEQQMKILLERQREFKLAAIEAKKGGEINQAKEYLKIYKGFDALLNAASSGMPVDLNTLPVPPSQRDDLEASFAIVLPEECDLNNDITDIGVRMEEQLAKQLMMCKNTRDHHKAMGDIAGMNRFENLAITVQKDLDLVRYSKRKNFPLPKFHYEKRNFNIVHCNTDLTDNELEINVLRGINFNVSNPKDVDTYVKVEFPLLNDESFKVKTNVIKDTDSPDYTERFKIEIQRGNRQFQRIFKRHGVKFEVYSRGGFLRSDALIGTVIVKLRPLETKCDIHDTYNLMEGRKQVGGKLEIKVRVRNPILTKQIEHINENWLVLEHGA